MDHATIGRAIRVVRVRRRVRQRDLAALVDRSQPTISRLERGRLGGVTIDTLERVCSELGIRVTISLRWEGAELDRLLGARHSAMHDEVARLFGDLAGWVTVPEVTFAIYAERGVIDILAWHAATRSLLVIELKTELVDVQETVGTLDRKRRLAAQIAAERGWRPFTVSSWLLVADGRTNRRRVPGAPLDAPDGVPGRRPDDDELAAIAGGIGRRAVVPVVESRHECEAGVRAGAARERPARERGSGAVGGHRVAGRMVGQVWGIRVGPALRSRMRGRVSGVVSCSHACGEWMFAGGRMVARWHAAHECMTGRTGEDGMTGEDGHDRGGRG